MSIFGKENLPESRVPRNNFDLSFNSHISFDIGQLIPNYVQEVVPGSTFKIDSSLGFRFQPLVFPIQTKMRFIQHFFYVRNRNLWTGWKDYVANTALEPGDVPPYIAAKSNEFYRTGSLSDYLGVPTTLVGRYGGDVEYSLVIGSDGYDCLSLYNTISHSEVLGNLSNFNTRMPAVGEKAFFDQKRNILGKFGPYISEPQWYRSPLQVVELNNVDFASPIKITSSGKFGYYFVCGSDTDIVDSKVVFSKLIEPVGTEYDTMDELKDIHDRYKHFWICFGVRNEHAVSTLLVTVDMSGRSVHGTGYLQGPAKSAATPQYKLQTISYTILKAAGFSDLTNYNTNPFSKDILLSAFPYRAYESIYNCFYRNERNDPFIVKGRAEYQRFLASMKGGADSFNYEIRYRNWENDFLTTALQSPQQGAAPLVGLTNVDSRGVFHFEDGTSVNVNVSSDGDTIDGISSYTPGTEPGTLRRLVDAITNGISISDFRNVNALQRFLEKNIRRGYKYIDVLKSHFGVDATYEELDYPEFIGGFSQDVNIQQINQTSEGTPDSPLGSYAGQAFAMGGSRHQVQKYCDEHGFIIGILCCVPVPVYSQLLPKYFLKTKNILDYYFPEFSKISMQPITYKEVCPLQSWTAKDNLDDVFGYQRPWYDYIARVDEVHGEFRSTMRNFTMQRIFSSRPVLGPEFLHINPSEVNAPFVYTGDGEFEKFDKIFGMCHFDVVGKLPIPRVYQSGIE